MLSPGRKSTAFDDRQSRTLLYRLGRAARDSLAARQDLLKQRGPNARGGTGISLQELLQLCSKHQIPLSRAEVVALFWRYQVDEGVYGDVFEEAIRNGELEPPPEMTWAQQTIAAAGVAARTEGQQLAIDLVQLGGADATAETGGLRELLARHTPLDEERWNALLLALDKGHDGKVLLAPVVQWAAGIGMFDSEVIVAEPMPDEDFNAHVIVPGGRNPSFSSSPRLPLPVVMEENGSDNEDP